MCQLTTEQREAYEDFLGSDLVHKVARHSPLATYHSPLTTHCLLLTTPRSRPLVHKVLTA